MTDVTTRVPMDPRSVFYDLAESLRSRVLTAGDLAEIRRMDATRLDAGGFWKLVGLHLDSILPGQAEARDRAETAWGTVAIAVATLKDLQRRGERLGYALALSGYSELRFVRLLRADHERLRDDVPQLARFLVAKQQPADLMQAAVLLVGSDSIRDRTRHHLARDYYSQLNDKS